MQTLYPLRLGVRDGVMQNRCTFPQRILTGVDRAKLRWISWRRDFISTPTLPGRLGIEYSKCPAVSQTGIFPSGKKQPQLEIPAFLLSISAKEALENKEKTLGEMNLSIMGGVTGVLLYEDGVNSAELYEVALQVQEALRDRASFIIVGRSDIAEAVDATGVLLTKEGVPLTVARRMLNRRSCLLGRFVETVEEVRQVAAEGASFVCFSRQNEMISMEELKKAKQAQRGGTIPVLTFVDKECVEDISVKEYLQSELDGVIVKLNAFEKVGAATGLSSAATSQEIAATLKQLLSEETVIMEDVAAEAKNAAIEVTRPKRLLLTESRENLLLQEKETLFSCLSTLQKISPNLEETFLLEGAIRQLDELFLVVVVGEYNSGKSSVINALLGSRFLDEGILPTTNEISVLRFAEQDPTVKTLDDGTVERTLPATLLQEINIVDTPGTNVVLERQQRLTEEYVPRADMILFVLSCDRPFTESEVKFLEYIRKWGKKVIFVVNKIDILAGEDEVETVASFVSQNARRLLNLTEAYVWPVSARRALDAKIAIGNSSFGGMYPKPSAAELEKDTRWRTSRFARLENFVSEFFSGAEGAASAESVRLKLQTPLYVADALLDASRQQLTNERIAAESDVSASRQVSVQLRQFEKEMRRDSGVQQQVICSLLDKVANKAEAFIDKTLLVANFFTLRRYLSENSSLDTKVSSKMLSEFSTSVLGNVIREMTELDDQHSIWLDKNCSRQMTNYRSFAEKCAMQFENSLEAIIEQYQSQSRSTNKNDNNDTLQVQGSTSGKDTEALSDLTEAQLIQAVKERDFSLLKSPGIVGLVFRNPSLGIQLLEALLEAEIRDAVNATGGTAIAAVGVGLLLTAILPSTLEDILALGFSLLIGYAALINLPLRRGEIKSRIQKFKTALSKQISKRLDHDLNSTLLDTTNRVQRMIQPLERMFEMELEQVKQNEHSRSKAEADLRNLRKKILSIE